MRRAAWLALFLLIPAPLLAAPLEPLDAAALLAEVRAANAKCGFLSANASEELSLYAGRAEVAAVEVVGAETASAKLAQARVDGGNYPCDEASGKKVTEIYTAAREAMQAVLAETQTTPPAAPAAPVASAQPAPKPAPQPVRLQPVPQPVPQPAPQPVAAPRLITPQPIAAPAPQPQRLQPAPQPVLLVQPAPQRRHHWWWPFGRDRNASQLQQAQQVQYLAPVPPVQPAPVVRRMPQPIAPVLQAAPAASPRHFLARFTTVLENPAAVAPRCAVAPRPVVAAPAIAPVLAPARPLLAAPQPANVAALEAYANRALGYYAGVRCPSMPAADMRRFWQNLANEHGRMLETMNPAAIEAALRRAEKQSQGMACDARTKQFVLSIAAQY